MVAFVVRPLAEADIDEAFAWYERRSVSLGVDFLRAVDVCFGAIAATPLGYRWCTDVYGAASFDGFRTPCSMFSAKTPSKFLRVRIRDGTRDTGAGAFDA